jgi:dolichol kinase
MGKEDSYFLLRKSFHALAGIVLLFIALEAWTNLKVNIFRWLLIAALLLVFLMEYLRLDWGLRLPFFRETEKGKEHHHLHGITLGALGAVLCLLMFDFTIAIAALSMQFLGDPAGAIAGRYFGKTRLFRKKTLQGSLAMLAVSMLVGYVILESWKLSAMMAVTAALSEALLDAMDDNLVVPVTTGAIGQLFSILWRL